MPEGVFPPVSDEAITAEWGKAFQAAVPVVRQNFGGEFPDAKPISNGLAPITTEYAFWFTPHNLADAGKIHATLRVVIVSPYMHRAADVPWSVGYEGQFGETDEGLCLKTLRLTDQQRHHDIIAGQMVAPLERTMLAYLSAPARPGEGPRFIDSLWRMPEPAGV